LLGPLEAANGMLMFGVTTAMIFALIQWLIQLRFVDLNPDLVSTHKASPSAQTTWVAQPKEEPQSPRNES
jgi:hypothetical protein